MDVFRGKMSIIGLDKSAGYFIYLVFWGQKVRYGA